MKRFHVSAALLALAGGAAAQTTHVVDVGPGFAFEPAELTVEVGDTVRWEWVGTFFHTVESGAGGVPDGIFSSGAPAVAPKSFSVTFDPAFVAANPVANDAYLYFCAVHEPAFGMTGSVHVVQPYGCVNPPSSLVSIAGAPKLGSAWTLGVDNYVAGGQSPGSLSFLAFSVAPAPGFPCGLPAPGFHMNPLAGPGELLIALTPPNPAVTAGPQVWPGPSVPAQFSIPIPADPVLSGVDLYTQGLILDFTGPNTFGASSGIRSTLN